MENITNVGLTPIGMQENGETISITSEERNGIVYIFGRSGQGKSVTLENIIISDIYSGKGGMFIDPFGDLANDIQSYIPSEKAKNVSVFEAQKGTLDENIAKFQQEIDFAEMKKDTKKLLFCKLDYRTLGSEGARELGIYLVKQFLEMVGGENRSLILDEAHNFIDDEVLEKILKSKEQELSCILLDQTSTYYRADVLDRLLESTDHVLCYQPDKLTAEVLGRHYKEMSPSELASLEKFSFRAILNTKTFSPTTLKLKGVFPISFPKN